MSNTQLSDLAKNERKLLSWWWEHHQHTGLTPYGVSTRSNWSEEEAKNIMQPLVDKGLMNTAMRTTQSFGDRGKLKKKSIGPWYHFTDEGKRLAEQANEGYMDLSQYD